MPLGSSAHVIKDAARQAEIKAFQSRFGAAAAAGGNRSWVTGAHTGAHSSDRGLNQPQCRNFRRACGSLQNRCAWQPHARSVRLRRRSVEPRTGIAFDLANAGPPGSLQQSRDPL